MVRHIFIHITNKKIVYLHNIIGEKKKKKRNKNILTKID